MEKGELRAELMKQSDEAKEEKAIENLKKALYDKCWKILKIRVDKSLPNNVEVTRKIEESIRDGINETELINKNRDLIRLAEARAQ